MSFKIPYAVLSEQDRKDIARDCVLTETMCYSRGKQKFFQKPKTLKFYNTNESDGTISIPMYYASELFSRNQINRVRNFWKIPPFNMSPGFELRDYQKMSIELAFGHYNKYSTAFFNVYCSYGKTTLGAYTASVFSHQYSLLTLVTYHRILIGKSWIQTFRENTDAVIYIVGETKGPIPDNVQVILCMDTRIGNLSTEILSRVGHLVIDEAHCYCTEKKGQMLLNIQPLFLTLLTATYKRKDGFHKMLDLMAGPVKITRVAPKQFFVFHIPTPFTANPGENSFGMIHSELIDEFDNNDCRNSMLLQTVMDNIDEKIMIVFAHRATAVRFYYWCLQYFVHMGKRVSLLAGDINEYEDGDIIVATRSKVGTGFDEKGSCRAWEGRRINFLINANSVRSFEQLGGRSFRADIPVIVTFGDSHSNVKSQWQENVRLFNKQNGVVIELEQCQRFCWALMRETVLEQYREEGERRAKEIYEREIKLDLQNTVAGKLVSSRRVKETSSEETQEEATYHPPSPPPSGSTSQSSYKRIDPRANVESLAEDMASKYAHLIF